MKKGVVENFGSKVLALLLLLCSANASATLPNIIVFIADDLTYRDIGVYGNKDVRTPNLDEFAQQGLRFTHAFASSAMCASTRMELYSGLQPVRSGAHPNHSRVYPDVRSLPNYLRPLGYEVAILGKRHEAPAENFSFNHLGGKHGDKGDAKVDLDLSIAKTFIDQAKGPFALVVASNQPHTPWTRGNPDTYDAEKLKIPGDLIDTPETRRAMTHYYAEISYMDNQFGQIVEYLEASPHADNTLMMFVSEQGSNFPFAKWTLYDSGHHAAVIARWPGKIAEGREAHAMVQYADFVPTLVELAGQDPAPLDLDGRSFLPVLLGKTDQHRELVFAVHTTRGIFHGAESYPIRSVRNHRFKLIWNLNHSAQFANTVVASGGPIGSYKSWLKAGDDTVKERAKAYQNRPEFELYDLENDPYELKNLAGLKEYDHTQKQLLGELKGWMQQQGDEGNATEMQALDRKRRGARESAVGTPANGHLLDWSWAQ